MHEVSLVRSVLASLDDALSPEEHAALEEIRLKVGTLSGVEPMLLTSAYDLVVQGTPYEGVRLAVTSVPARVRCGVCQTAFTPVRQRFVCPACDTPSNDLLAGDELLIEQVVLADPVPES
ncbi:MAG: hydrogenase maturation nickel metallochaperone HypA [Bacteroidota bacterium]